MQAEQQHCCCLGWLVAVSTPSQQKHRMWAHGPGYDEGSTCFRCHMLLWHVVKISPQLRLYIVDKDLGWLKCKHILKLLRKTANTHKSNTSSRDRISELRLASFFFFGSARKEFVAATPTTSAISDTAGSYLHLLSLPSSTAHSWVYPRIVT